MAVEPSPALTPGAGRDSGSGRWGSCREGRGGAADCGGEKLLLDSGILKNKGPWLLLLCWCQLNWGCLCTTVSPLDLPLRMAFQFKVAANRYAQVLARVQRNNMTPMWQYV